MNLVTQLIPKSDAKTVEKWIKLALDIITKRGITNIHDAWQEPVTIDVIKKLDDKGGLPIRCFGMLGSSYSKLLDQYFQYCLTKMVL